MTANVARNRLEPHGARRARWSTSRDAAWQLISRHLPPGATVAIVGAGNGEDLPLSRIAARSEQLDLYDIDPRALRRARRLIAGSERRTVHGYRYDISGGEADRITRAVSAGETPSPVAPHLEPLDDGGYDVVIGDLFYTQLLYPALLDGGLPAPQINRTLSEHGPPLTRAAVTVLQSSVRPSGVVIHIHDAVGWWSGHDQPVSLEAILATPRLRDQLALIRSCRRPTGADPRDALEELGVPVCDTALWEWPFTADARYLACATVTRGGPPGAANAPTSATRAWPA